MRVTAIEAGVRKMEKRQEIRVTLLAENTARGRGILGEHGLAYWIETDDGRLLFDTGQGHVLRRNAETLGIDLASADAIVLSHGHYDHVGGLEPELVRSPRAVVYLHPDALRERFIRKDEGMYPVNEEFLFGGRIEEGTAHLCKTGEPVEVLPGVWTTGEVPRLTDYEDTGGAFFLDEAGTKTDPIRDDQALYFRTGKGIVLILGCAHAGVVNTMRHVAGLTGEERLHAVIGGMHLLHAGEERLEQTYRVFDEMEVELIAPCHCTGIRATVGFWNRFGDRCREAHAGKAFRFDGVS